MRALFCQNIIWPSSRKWGSCIKIDENLIKRIVLNIWLAIKNPQAIIPDDWAFQWQIFCLNKKKKVIFFSHNLGFDPSHI